MEWQFYLGLGLGLIIGTLIGKVQSTKSWVDLLRDRFDHLPCDHSVSLVVSLNHDKIDEDDGGNMVPFSPNEQQQWQNN